MKPSLSHIWVFKLTYQKKFQHLFFLSPNYFNTIFVIFFVLLKFFFWSQNSFPIGSSCFIRAIFFCRFPFRGTWPCLFTEMISCLLSLFLTDGRLNKAKLSVMVFLVQYEQSDHVITILKHSLMTKKHWLCILLIVQIIVFMWRQRGLLFFCCVYCPFSICFSHLNLLKVLNFG